MISQVIFVYRDFGARHDAAGEIEEKNEIIISFLKAKLKLVLFVVVIVLNHRRLGNRYNDFTKKNYASAENRTRINCLEGNYADHYTTNALIFPLLISEKMMILVKRIVFIYLTYIMNKKLL
jgi:hypothetical protein